VTRRWSLSEAEEAEVVARYKAGLSTLQLAERFGITDMSVRRTLDRHGVERRPRQERLDINPQDVADRRALGWTWAQIAAWAGCSPTTARNRWKEGDSTGS
jgi:hypothetical protein